jgi:hypothetical protein
MTSRAAADVAGAGHPEHVEQARDPHGEAERASRYASIL